MIACPQGREFLPYQIKGILFAAERPASLIADDPGLGKTIEAIGVLNLHHDWHDVLVVCPASLKINWRREIDKWLTNSFIVVTIVNYDMLHKLNLSKQWDCVILDEAQYIKNKKEKRTKLVKQIKTYNRIALTGTPILNRPIELWSILNWLRPDIWPPSSYMRYALSYCGAYRGTWGWDMTGASHLDELREVLKPHMIRRLKTDVLTELPAKRRQIIELSRDGINQALLDKLRQAAVDVYQIEGQYRDDVRALESILSVLFTQMAQLRHEVGMAKIPAALEVIHDAVESSGKVVIFAHHRDVIQTLYDSLVDYRPAVVHGGTSEKARQDAVDRFQRDPNVKVLVGQIQAAGVGITLTAASHVIFVELDWTPGNITQAEDRCHRIGQKDAVLVQHLVLENSLDARMAKLLVKKQEIIERVLNQKEKEEIDELWFRKKKAIKKRKAQMLWAKMCSLNDKESKSLRRLRRKLAKKKLKGGK